MMHRLLLFYLFTITNGIDEKVPSNYQRLCGYSEIPIDGDEGQFESANFGLRGISIIFRHGQRFDSNNLPPTLERTPTSCEPFLQQDRQRFSQFERTVSSKEFTSLLELSSLNFGEFTTIPEKSQCITGQLLPEGALQLEKIGHFLRYRYESLLNVEAQIRIETTNYNRTVQSAIAFCSGLLYPKRKHLTDVKFTIADNDMLCFSAKCSCPFAQKLWENEQKEAFFTIGNIVSFQLQETFHQIANPFLLKLWINIRKIPIFSECFDPQRMLDTALTRFVCRRRPLPCKDKVCLTFKDLDEIQKFTTKRGIYWYNQGDKYMRASVDHLRAYNFFKIVLSEAEKQENNPFIQILSAHDVTLGGILHSINVPFSDPPRYASRLLIEFYENREKDLYFRMLYNGLDITGSLEFCKDIEEGLCSLKELKELYYRLDELTEETRQKCQKQ